MKKLLAFVSLLCLLAGCIPAFGETIPSLKEHYADQFDFAPPRHGLPFPVRISAV